MSERELLRVEAIPIYQNRMYASAAAARACPRGEMVLVQDLASGLTYNRAFEAGRLVYDPSYQNEQGHSQAFQTHIGEVLELLGRHFQGKSVLEIGCGKGGFLELLRAAGHDARGIDPAYEGDSEHIVREHFAPGLGIRGDAIVMRHVLEHIPQPADFLEQVRIANGSGALIYIEVPCLDWIIEHHAWFDVFYEHVNYFRQADFLRLFERVVAAGTLFGGQYLYAIAELDSLRDPRLSPAPVAPVEMPADFFANLERCAQAARAHPNRAVWGAAAKGVMFSHHLQARGLAPALAIDINPAKQGHFLAGSGLPVVAPAAAFAQLGPAPAIFVMNSNYLAEIRAMGGPGPNYIAVDQ